jgi:cation:H+ antiporter
MSERVIGLTIVSAGTGLPEVVASLVSALRGRSDVAIGNVIGSNLFNILIILGLSGIIVPLPVQPMIANSDCWWMLGSTAIILPIILNGHRIYRWEGFLLIAIYVAYIGLLLYKSPALPAETLHY